MLALLVGSGIAFLLGVVLAWRSAVLTRRGIRVEGLVVERPNVSGDEISDTIVEFADHQGNTQRKKLVGSSSDDPPVGQSMRLVYNPSDPNEVSGASFARLWLGPLIACLLGGLGIVAVVCVVCKKLAVLPDN
jgi:hypothetical protein